MYARIEKSKQKKPKTLSLPEERSAPVQDDSGQSKQNNPTFPCRQVSGGFYMCHPASGSLAPGASLALLGIFSSLLAIFSTGNRNT